MRWSWWHAKHYFLELLHSSMEDSRIFYYFHSMMNTVHLLKSNLMFMHSVKKKWKPSMFLYNGSKEHLFKSKTMYPWRSSWSKTFLCLLYIHYIRMENFVSICFWSLSIYELNMFIQWVYVSSTWFVSSWIMAFVTLTRSLSIFGPRPYGYLFVHLHSPFKLFLFDLEQIHVIKHILNHLYKFYMIVSNLSLLYLFVLSVNTLPRRTIEN